MDKKNDLKKLIGILLVLLIAFSALKAFFLIQDAVLNQSRKEQSEDILYKKYGIEFEVTRVENMSYFDTSYQITAHPKSDSNIVFDASVENDGSSISDEYISRYICDKIEKKITTNLSGLEGNYYVKVGVEIKTTNSSDANMNIGKYLSLQPDQDFLVHVIYAGDINSENYQSKISHALNGLGMIKGRLHSYSGTDKIVSDVENLFHEHANVDASFINLTNSCDTVITIF